MRTLRLYLVGDSRRSQWILDWDDIAFVLTNPQGDDVLRIQTDEAHKTLNLKRLYADGMIIFPMPTGRLWFVGDGMAAHELREVIDAALSREPMLIAPLRRSAVWSLTRGILLRCFVFGLFSLYCWWIFVTNDPLPGTWLHWVLIWFGWPIHFVMIVLTAITYANSLPIWSDIRQIIEFNRLVRPVLIRPDEVSSHAITPHA